MTPDSLSRGLGGRLEPVSKVVNTHLLVLASGRYTWLTWSRTVPYTSCGLHSLRMTRDSWHTAAKCISYMLLCSPYHLHSKSLVPFIFRKSWHVCIDVCSIMNEFFLSGVILSMLWHKEKGANINNSSVTRFTCIYEILSKHPIQKRFLKDYSCTCKDRRSTDIIHEFQACK